MFLGTTSRLSGNQLEDDGSSVCILSLACNPIKIGRWSELMVVCVCHSDEVMREADAAPTPLLGAGGVDIPLSQRRQEARLILFYKIINGLAL